VKRSHDVPGTVMRINGAGTVSESETTALDDRRDPLPDDLYVVCPQE
jgi:hypothetical protein